MKKENKRKTITIDLKKIILLILIIIVISLIIFIKNTIKLKLEPSDSLNESVRIFEQRENKLFRYEIIRYATRLNVTEFPHNKTTKEMGMNLDPTNLYLGRIPISSSSEKTLNLTNNLNESYKMNFFVFGNISKLIKLEKEITIKPGQNIEYLIIAKTDLRTPIGMYTGEIDIVTIIPKNLLGKILQKVM